MNSVRLHYTEEFVLLDIPDESLAAMYSFLSPESVAEHIEYYRKLLLRRSIAEKSIPKIRGADWRSLSERGLPRGIVMEVAPLLYECEEHRLYFSSFCEQKPDSPSMSASGDIARFIYDVYKACSEAHSDFVTLCVDPFRRDVLIDCDTYSTRVLRRCIPVLALDICEHAYFRVYGFDRDRYIREALRHFDLEKITKVLDIRKKHGFYG